ncbi:MAG: LacI family DNA-binding transcriptional regulator [Trueperaceae bacterium]|nr:LacI family DNA-binding transcriptional regulator [Trueperaceae bacterium]
MSSIKDVSRYANVSPSTVSRVLNGTAPVNAATKERVLKAVAHLNYKPNAFARGLVTNRSGGIGVIINEISSSFHSTLVQGIENVIEAAGMHLIVSSGHAKATRELKALNFISQRRPDAIIVRLETLSDDEILDWLEHENVQNIPVVLIGRFIPELADSCIHLDNELGGYLATQHLLATGHQKIAHISGPLLLKDSRDRLQGYRRGLEEVGLAYDESYVIEGQFTETSGQQAMQALLERNLNLDAIFVANDQMAVGAFHILRQAGIRIPEDISIIGFDDLLISRYLYPALSTIRQPLIAMGEAAAQVALRELHQKDIKVEQSFTPELIQRQSVATRH